MTGRHVHSLVDRALLARAFLVLGGTEAVVAIGAFVGVLLLGGWGWGETPEADLLAVASGSAFAAIALGQVTNSFACRSTSRPVWRLRLLDNPLVLAAAAAELVLLGLFLGLPSLSALLGGAWPSLAGWSLALVAVPAVLAADTLAKTWLARRRSTGRTGWTDDLRNR